MGSSIDGRNIRGVDVSSIVSNVVAPFSSKYVLRFIDYAACSPKTNVSHSRGIPCRSFCVVLTLK